MLFSLDYAQVGVEWIVVEEGGCGFAFGIFGIFGSSGGGGVVVGIIIGRKYLKGGKVGVDAACDEGVGFENVVEQFIVSVVYCCCSC